MSDIQQFGSAPCSDGTRLPAAAPAQRTRASADRPALAVADWTRRDVEAPAARPMLLSARDIRKSYRKAQVEIPVLRGVDLEVRQGEFLSIIGQSGSGKSTLLHICATLDNADSGEIHFAGQRIDHLPRSRRDALRNKRFGMIFQFYHLLPELTALENVLSPWMIGQGVFEYLRNRKAQQQRAIELLGKVGLDHRLKHKPRELSGGEMQRVAIARALAAEPEVLFADEPTGNLDTASGEEILSILRTLNAETNLTIVMVTHDRGIAAGADRTVRLAQGRVEDV
ncbi:MAG TPA: ABC transporter ATP-binding protein [Pirellulales bacterium]|jgi:lipoprotein-releasing system ATP-binding protein|nr:ABC transporter ATP-binding protein [Pirellulales bacterium]